MSSIHGVEALVKKLRVTMKHRAVKAGRKAIGEGEKLVLSAMKDTVPVETSTLKKSLGRKTKVYGNTVVGIIGARVDKGRFVVIRGRDEYRNPVKYDHLIELGHRTNVRGRHYTRDAASTPGLGEKIERTCWEELQ